MTDAGAGSDDCIAPSCFLFFETTEAVRSATTIQDTNGVTRNGNAGLAIRGPRATKPYTTNDPSEIASIDEKYGTLPDNEDRIMVNHKHALATNGEETQNVNSAIKTVELL